MNKKEKREKLDKVIKTTSDAFMLLFGCIIYIFLLCINGATILILHKHVMETYLFADVYMMLIFGNFCIFSVLSYMYYSQFKKKEND
jgi:membrane protein implicated in regulation of membrane protease activity